jgi:hypothetical protein
MGVFLGQLLSDLVNRSLRWCTDHLQVSDLDRVGGLAASRPQAPTFLRIHSSSQRPYSGIVVVQAHRLRFLVCPPLWRLGAADLSLLTRCGGVDECLDGFRSVGLLVEPLGHHAIPVTIRQDKIEPVTIA